MEVKGESRPLTSEAPIDNTGQRRLAPLELSGPTTEYRTLLTLLSGVMHTE